MKREWPWAGWGVVILLVGLTFLPFVYSATTATTLFRFIVPNTYSLSITYGGNCNSSAFFFNEIDANFDPDSDGNAARVKPRPIRFNFSTAKSDENFLGVSNPSQNHAAYSGNLSAKPATVNNTPSVQLSTANYTSIGSDNTNYYSQFASTADTYPSLRAVFRPQAKNPNLITQKITDINVLFVGNSHFGDEELACGSATMGNADLNIYIWNYNLGRYDTIASLGGSGSSSPGATYLSDHLNNNVLDYISNQDGNITILVQGPTGDGVGNQGCLVVDFIDLNLTYYPTSTDFCQSSTLASMTITNTGNVDINVDGNFSTAFTGSDLNIVLKIWMGDGTGCGSDGNGLGGWSESCGATTATDTITTGKCRQWNSSNATTKGRLTTKLLVGDTNQLCYSGDFNRFVSSGDHNKVFQVGANT